ncbi:short chain dehydrogenase domain-containing protein [Ditylenchus destructor]|uniref:Short chain dehydrogenase domain-containing protein n=1 Tax=Ditylenchus destructor TaxID=166010 RepID=A0AAD4NCD6_9BILA|nr:short chain dehydrogenase domain-containing protein [Ditylenchus destructor]
MTSTVSDYVASFKSVLADFGNYFHATLISGTKGDAAVPKWMWVPVAAPIVYYSARYLWELATVTDLKNKVVFIAGADSGFGYLLAVKCAINDLTVFAGCLTEEGRDRLREETKHLPGRIIPVQLDVTDDDSVKAASEFVQYNLDQGQYLWALVLNAGFLAHYGPDPWCTVADYHKPMNINAFGMIRCVHAFLPMIKQSKGRIIAASSIAGRFSQAYGVAYSMSKYAVEAYTDGIRQELQPYGITVSILEPGAFRTNFVSYDAHRERVEGIWSRMPQDLRDEYGEDYKNKCKLLHRLTKSCDWKKH